MELALIVVYEADNMTEAWMLQQVTQGRRNHSNIVSFDFWCYNDSMVIPFAEYYLPFFKLGDLAELANQHIERHIAIPEMFIMKVRPPVLQSLGKIC